MSTTSLHHSYDSRHRIFFLSAVGSAIFHVALLTGLMYLPRTQVPDKTPPTIQVKLIQVPSESISASPPHPQSPDPAPHDPSERSSSPAKPSQPPKIPPSQASLSPVPSKPMVPPQPSSKKELQSPDTPPEPVIKTREMAKMAVPQNFQRSTASPVLPRREPDLSRMPMDLKNTQNAQPTLPPPRFPTAFPALKASTPNSSEFSTSKPMIVSSSKPLYPRLARESGWEGTVIIRTLISSEGDPTKVEIRKSCGYETLDLAAQEAIKTWKFQPAKDGNIPIAKWVDIPIKFDLNS